MDVYDVAEHCLVMRAAQVQQLQKHVPSCLDNIWMSRWLGSDMELCHMSPTIMEKLSDIQMPFVRNSDACAWQCY